MHIGVLASIFTEQFPLEKYTEWAPLWAYLESRSYGQFYKWLIVQSLKNNCFHLLQASDILSGDLEFSITDVLDIELSVLRLQFEEHVTKNTAF